MLYDNRRHISITHNPSGVSVYCNGDRSQHRNKNNALAILRSNLYSIVNAPSFSDRPKYSYTLTGDEQYPDDLQQHRRAL